ncbi:hypothetical protein AAFF_G00202530 [Aldrovandia affinis]|uniref:Uncharacterized protein n=1 Tax=Aldrovandia affinis TaxID=143900 RepID=A0AAD7SY37_9TELE|nr:hypothetical protein AAFF_G00202530 [Aldrovandia affinis]
MSLGCGLQAPGGEAELRYMERAAGSGGSHRQWWLRHKKRSAGARRPGDATGRVSGGGGLLVKPAFAVTSRRDYGRWVDSGQIMALSDRITFKRRGLDADTPRTFSQNEVITGGGRSSFS